MGQGKVGMKRLAGLQDTKDQKQELAHDSGNDGHLTQTSVQEALSKDRQHRVAAFSDDGRHIQGSTNGAVAGIGNDGFLSDRRAGLVMGRVQASKGDELAHIVKVGQGATFGQEFSGGQPTNAGNGGQPVARLLEVGMSVNMVLKGAFELLDLVLEQIALMLPLLDDQGGQRGALAQAIIDGLLGCLQDGQMAHQGLQMRDVLRRGLPQA